MATRTSSNLSLQNFQEMILKNIEDVVNYEPMEEASIITSCGHSFSELTIKQCLSKIKPCPNGGSQPIKNYIADHTMRMLIAKVNAFIQKANGTLEELQVLVLAELKDCDSNALLEKPVTLIPCGHTVSEKTALKYLHSTKLCPFDKKNRFDEWVVNYTIKGLLEDIKPYLPNESVSAASLEKKAPPDRITTARSVEISKVENLNEHAHADFLRAKALYEKGDKAAAVNLFLEIPKSASCYQEVLTYINLCFQQSSQVISTAVELEALTDDQFKEMAKETAHTYAAAELEPLIDDQFEEMVKETAHDYFVQGQEFYKSGDKSQAANFFLDALNLNPNHKEAHVYLGLCLPKHDSTPSLTTHSSTSSSTAMPVKKTELPVFNIEKKPHFQIPKRFPDFSIPKRFPDLPRSPIEKYRDSFK